MHFYKSKVMIVQTLINVSEISATSSLPFSDITDLDEFSTFETDNCASTTQNHQPIDEEWNSLKTN